MATGAGLGVTIDYGTLHSVVCRAPLGTIVAVSFADGVGLELRSPDGPTALAIPGPSLTSFLAFSELSEVIQAASPGTAATMACAGGLILSVATRGASAPYPPPSQQRPTAPPWQQELARSGGRTLTADTAPRIPPSINLQSSDTPAEANSKTRSRPRVRSGAFISSFPPAPHRSHRSDSTHDRGDLKQQAPRQGIPPRQVPRKLHEIPREVRRVTHAGSVLAPTIGAVSDAIDFFAWLCSFRSDGRCS